MIQSTFIWIISLRIARLGISEDWITLILTLHHNRNLNLKKNHYIFLDALGILLLKSKFTVSIEKD